MASTIVEMGIWTMEHKPDAARESSSLRMCSESLGAMVLAVQRTDLPMLLLFASATMVVPYGNRSIMPIVLSVLHASSKTASRP